VSLGAILLVLVATVAGMEAFAWLAHKYVMHGWGWAWHRDHHEPHEGVLERNDGYAAVFSAIVIVMFTAGARWSPLLWWVALGITLYGFIYALVHDGLVHQRFMRWVPKKGYAKRLVQAHKLHHATVGKEGGVSFGFLFAADPAWLKARLRQQVAAKQARLREPG
jgi:beta-carotene 3-hydroxylase